VGLEEKLKKKEFGGQRLQTLARDTPDAGTALPVIAADGRGEAEWRMKWPGINRIWASFFRSLEDEKWANADRRYG